MDSFATIQSLREKLQKKELSPQEVVAHYQARIKKYNPQLNAVIEQFDDAKVPDNLDLSAPLAGIPTVIKDNICQKDRVTSAGSKILANYKAPYDATVIERIKEAGSISLGRTNMDEFAMGGSGEFSAYGPTKNPWDLTRVPGGSGSGSAAAVAAGLAPYSLSSETGGSIRQPAAFCNLVGLYPTYGLNSRYGALAFASSTDQIGPKTRTVYDNALVQSVISGNDRRDSTSTQQPAKDYTKNLNGKLPQSLTIGVIQEAIDTDGLDPQIRKSFVDSIKQLESLGAKIKYLSMPNLKYGIAVYFVISRAEAASNLSRYDGSIYGMRNKEAHELFDMYLRTRQEGFGIEVKRRILVGNYVLSAGHQDAFYKKANQVRALIRAEFQDAFKNVDLLVSPTTSTLPFKLGETLNDPLAMYMTDFYTVPTCVIGTPGLSLPCGFSQEGLPIGFQFLGPALSEELIYQAAYAFEQSTDYHKKVPAGYE
jgi:aspartyl-tRNA(Asn)/glutamyl-tRNA(Gln) amidotransferase subunit A